MPGKGKRASVCPAWPRCACILPGRKDVDCKYPYGSNVCSADQIRWAKERYDRGTKLVAGLVGKLSPLLSGLDLLPCGHRKADWVQFPPSADTFGGALDKGYCSSCQREAAAVSAALEQAAAIVQEDADAIRDVDDAQAAHYEQDVQEILALPRNSSALDVERAKAKADAYERCAQEADADKDSVTFRKWRD